MECGSEIIRERFDYLNLLKKEVSEIYKEISDQKEELDINYICTVFKNNEQEKIELSKIKKEFEIKLKKSFISDLKTGSTNIGPHKDDLDIFVDGKKVKFFGSQGQIRSAALCLKLAEAEILKKNIGEPPIVLLDDVMSELDDLRKNYIISKIKNKQVFITNCDRSFFDKLKKSDMEGKLFEIKNGKISEEINF